MTITEVLDQNYRELACRTNEGVEVALFWHAVTNEVIVMVSDRETGVGFELTADPAKALEVFEHPYAYADTSFKRLHRLDVLLDSWVEATASHDEMAS